MLEKKTLGIIFANMHDSALGEMTAARSMGSMPFGGRYRMIDFYLSALSNSGVTKVGVMAKNNYSSLMDHLGSGRTWDLSRKREGISIFPPHRYEESEAVYHGRVQALSNILGYIRKSAVNYVVMMDCDFVCNLDIDAIVSYHIEKNADITLVCCNHFPTDSEMLNNCVMVSVDENQRIRKFYYNRLEENSQLSMNIFVMEKEKLIETIVESMATSSKYFDRDFLTENVDSLNIQSFLYEGYVSRVYGIKSYFDANMSLLDPENMRRLFLQSGPIYTKVHDEAPVRYGLKALCKNSILADGCVVEGSVENCVLFRGVTVEAGAVLKNSIIMQNTVVRQGAKLNYVITDKDVVITENRNLEGDINYPLYIKKAITV